MKLLKYFFICSIVFVLSATGDVFANSLDELIEDKNDSLNDVLNYPPEIRQALLEASLHPGTLNALDDKQKQSSEQFQGLISKYPRKTQEKVYNLVRYPKLIEALVQGGPKSKEQIKSLTRDYPKSIQDSAEDLGRNEYTLLRDLELLNRTHEQEFDNIINDLPGSSQNAFRTLLTYPEALQTLADNDSLAKALSQAYRDSPGATISRLDALSREAGEKNQEALSDYRETIQKDPKAQAEMKESAQAFAQENGYYSDYSGYDDPPPASYAGNSGNTVVNININPYPYWSGYPYWYARPIWRPYPLWFLTGFFWGFSQPVIYSYPSYYYTNWFYSYPRNFYRYPYLANCYGSHYYRYRNYYTYNNFNRVVHHWHNDHGRYVHNDMWRHDRRGAEYWRDFGRRYDKSPSFYSYRRDKTRDYERRHDRDRHGYWDSNRREERNSHRDRDRARVEPPRRDQDSHDRWKPDRPGSHPEKGRDRDRAHSDNRRNHQERGNGRTGQWQKDKPRPTPGWQKDKPENSNNGRRAHGEPWQRYQNKQRPDSTPGNTARPEKRRKEREESGKRAGPPRERVEHSPGNESPREGNVSNRPERASRMNAGYGSNPNHGHRSGSSINRGSSSASRNSFRSSGGPSRGGSSRSSTHQGNSRGRR